MIIVNGNNRLEWHENMTITDILKAMNYSYSLIVVSVNEKIISEEDYDDFVVKDNAQVKVIHICHGG